MKKTLLRNLTFLIALLALPMARAEIVQDLYVAQVPVTDRSAAALAQGAKDALAVVLIKVSGSGQLLQSPVIVEALAKARRHVQKYGYLRGDDPQRTLNVRVEFDDAYVTGLVTKAGAPLWTANRPTVLAWVVFDEPGGRHFLSRDRYPQMAAQLVAEFSRRGVTLELPLFDLIDASAVRERDAWGQDKEVLLKAASRYGTQEIVVGRVNVADSGDSSGDWTYFYGDKRIVKSFNRPDARRYWRSGADLVADNMAARYAVAPSAASLGAVGMTVSGVFGFGDYAGIVSWLESLEPIEHAIVERVVGDRVYLRLGARARAENLAAIIELNEKLIPEQSANNSASLSYRWQN